MMENEVLIKTPGEAIETIKFNMPTSGYQMLREALDMAISALKEIQQYREIGTVEECREGVEKQKPKKPVLRNDNGKLRKSCPTCGCFFSPLSRSCPKCGQAILWENEDD